VRAARDGGDHPRPVGLGGLAVGLQRVDERGHGGSGQPVEVGDDEGAAAVLQLAGHLADPLWSVVVGVEHAQVARGRAVLVGCPGERGLADAGLALQDQPLPRLEVPVDGLPALLPRRAGPDRSGQ
jgi:hypothetical protein